MFQKMGKFVVSCEMFNIYILVFR